MSSQCPPPFLDLSKVAIPAFQIVPLRGSKHAELTQVRRLHSAKARAAEQCYWIEGARLVLRSLTYGAEVDYLIATQDFLSSDEGGECLDWMKRHARHTYRIYEVSAGVMAGLSKSKPAPPCIAVLQQGEQVLSSFIAGTPLLMMADQLANIDNMGMLIRSVEAAGCDGLILTGETADPFHHRVARGSCGGIFKVPICRNQSLGSTIESMKEQGVQVVATSANVGVPYTSVDLTLPSVVLVGNEQRGLEPAALDAADVIAHIPMHGVLNSLNIAVAASLVLYEGVRQRGVAFANHGDHQAGLPR